jgi:hypothetical protein
MLIKDLDIYLLLTGVLFILVTRASCEVANEGDLRGDIFSLHHLLIKGLTYPSFGTKAGETH